MFIHVSEPRLSKFLVQHAFEGLEFFNVYERAAESLARDTPAVRGDRPILVVGAGQVGLSLVSQLARERDRYMRAANCRPAAGLRRRPRSDRSGSAADRDVFPAPRRPATCHAFDLDVDSPAFDRLVQQHPELSQVAMGFVCFDSDALTITTALNLHYQTGGQDAADGSRVRPEQGHRGAARAHRGRRGIRRPSNRSASPSMGAAPTSFSRGCAAASRARCARASAAATAEEPDDVEWEKLPSRSRAQSQPCGRHRRQLEDGRISPPPADRLGSPAGRADAGGHRGHGRARARALDERTPPRPGGATTRAPKDEVAKTHAGSPSLVGGLSDEAKDKDRDLVKRTTRDAGQGRDRDLSRNAYRRASRRPARRRGAPPPPRSRRPTPRGHST